MGFYIEKDFRFEAAHRLSAPYQGKCSHLHGHSFKVTLKIGPSAASMGASGDGLNEFGFVRDFSDLKPLQVWIDANFDHATLVSAQDQELCVWLKATKQKHFVFQGNPTSENIARILFQKAEEFGFAPLSMTVSETCTSRATFGVK